jgi:hypothetical protein
LATRGYPTNEDVVVTPETNSGNAMEEIDSRKKALRDEPSVSKFISFFADVDFFHDEGDNPSTQELGRTNKTNADNNFIASDIAFSWLFVLTASTGRGDDGEIVEL